MPDNSGDDPTVDLSPNPLILKLKSYGEGEMLRAGGGAEKVVPLLGYLGESGEADEFVYLYLQLDLSSYYRIAKTDIIYAQPIDASDPIKPTKVLVRASATISLVQTGEAKFLTGNIVANCLPVGPICPTSPVAAPVCGTLTEVRPTGPHCHTGTAIVTTGPHCQPNAPVQVTTGPHCGTGIIPQ